MKLSLCNGKQSQIAACLLSITLHVSNEDFVVAMPQSTADCNHRSNGNCAFTLRELPDQVFVTRKDAFPY
jgi:hypothetical protein